MRISKIQKIILLTILYLPLTLTNLNCTVDQCKLCQNTTKIKCTQCEEGYYLKTFYSNERQEYYNDCWSKYKLFGTIGALILSSLLFCGLIWFAYRRGVKSNLKGKSVEENEKKPEINQNEKKIENNGNMENLKKNENFENKDNFIGAENLPSTERNILRQDTMNPHQNKPYAVSITPSFNQKFGSKNFQIMNKKRTIFKNIQNTRRVVSPRNNNIKNMRVVRKIIHSRPQLKKKFNENNFQMGLMTKKRPKFQNKSAENSRICVSPGISQEQVFESFGSDKQDFTSGIQIKKPKTMYFNQNRNFKLNCRDKEYSSPGRFNNGRRREKNLPQISVHNFNKKNNNSKENYVMKKNQENRENYVKKISKPNNPSKIKIEIQTNRKINQSAIKPVLSPSMRGSGQRNRLGMHSSLVLNPRDLNERFPHFGFNTSKREEGNQEGKKKKFFQQVVEFNLPTDSKQFNTTPKNFKKN